MTTVSPATVASLLTAMTVGTVRGRNAILIVRKDRNAETTGMPAETTTRIGMDFVTTAITGIRMTTANPATVASLLTAMTVGIVRGRNGILIVKNGRNAETTAIGIIRLIGRTVLTTDPLTAQPTATGAT